MGWWPQDIEGRSFASDENSIGLWGDGPADAIDNAIVEIYREFNECVGRQPTKQELISGFMFSVGLTTEDGTRYPDNNTNQLPLIPIPD